MQGAEQLMGLLPLILMIPLFYFLIIRPQMKRNKEHKQLLNELAKGDEITTQGGLMGKVTQIGETVVHVEIADNVVIRIQKTAILAVLPKGSFKVIK